MSGTGDNRVRISIAEAEALARRVLTAAGASEAMADVMARALTRAEAEGLAGVGLKHLITYSDALAAGRIDGYAEPDIERPTPVVFRVDAKGGVGHLGFDRAFPDLVEAARTYGVAVFSQKNSYTNGALDWFVWRLAEAGLVAQAATNGGPALLAASGATERIFCTNPLSFAAPRAGEPPLVIDQSSSATAYVNLRIAAEKGDAIPEGWALDGNGNPTTDPAEALKGVLLPFGGQRGANVAMMVEVLSAGLSGANWSLDAPSFIEGDKTPGIGLFVVAISPDRLAEGFSERLAAYLDRLNDRYGVYVPGTGRSDAAASAESGGLELAADFWETLLRRAGAPE